MNTSVLLVFDQWHIIVDQNIKLYHKNICVSSTTQEFRQLRLAIANFLKSKADGGQRCLLIHNVHSNTKVAVHRKQVKDFWHFLSHAEKNARFIKSYQRQNQVRHYNPIVQEECMSFKLN
ncbi:hypothetical protein KFE98_20965 [bacterium SCSIO 12741]|nr:hypothetical protein KFE98_20965 [bacterium SCSIO 12741]